ncbi:MAG TPA: von Willebrand factor type A domain-containing protein [Opitutales bacterium]|nr:von Willebrand factor type A domain-containing protein [Opitutales bacterium]
MMKISKTDPRLTAYALGEIEDIEERHLIEEAVANDAELQAEVESIRSMGDLLAGGLESEAAPEFSEFEKAKLEQAPEAKRSPMAVLISWPVVATAAAAVLALLFIPQVGLIRFDAAADRALSEQGQSAADANGGVRYRQLEVDIPPELIEGTPQPIKVPNLEPAPKEAPRILVAESRNEANNQQETREKIEELSKASPPILQKPSIVVENPAKREIPALDIEVNVEEKSVYGRGAGGLAGGLSRVREQAAPELNRFGYSVKGNESGASGAAVRSRPALDEPVVMRDSLVPETNAPRPRPKPAGDKDWNTESYDPIEDTDFRSPLVAPLSTFSIDVDTASYANVRRFLNQGQLPPADAVRIEELINYFNYSDAAPAESLEEGGDPFAVHMAQATAPWNPEHRLMRIALKGYEMPWAERPASNLVFLLDVSGSMSSQNKLPLVKEAMQLLIRRLDERDRVAIVVYAGASGLVLPSTTANNTETIEHALDNLKAGGSTNAGAGIDLAYKVAREHFIEDGNNRVILCTDGDFNVGRTNRGELTRIADEQAGGGISLTILGFGMGNYKDDMLEDLSNKGKGSYAYVDSRAEARKVFLEDLASNIFKIAKDVKIQVEFNPEQVQAYRLIGYENRRLKAEDFNNDRKKAGDIGPGHSVVAFYEIVPVGGEFGLPRVDKLRYRKKSDAEVAPGEVATVKLRYKRPDAETSRLITQTAHSEDLREFAAANDDFRFGAAVAAFGLKLRDSETIGTFGYPEIERITTGALGGDSGGHRSEFTDLVRKAGELSKAD